MTMSAVGVFLREIAITDIAGLPAGQLPSWVPGLIARELIAVDTGTAKLALSSLSIKRDAALIILLAATEVPTALVYVVLAGLLAAALAARRSGSTRWARSSPRMSSAVRAVSWPPTASVAPCCVCRSSPLPRSAPGWRWWYPAIRSNC